MATLDKTVTVVNDKREIFGWAMYDWANSAFSTTVVTVFLGPYLSSLAEGTAKAQFLAQHGVEWDATVHAPLINYLFGIPIAYLFPSYCRYSSSPS